MRNPFRFTFDRETGLLWAGDVGQNAREEIGIITSDENHGWRCYEGMITFNTLGCDLLTTTFAEPQYEYAHDVGFSVTGGYVYRGNAYPQLHGTYFFGDFGSGTIWGLFEGDFMGSLISSGTSLVSFAEDTDGELYYIDLAFGGNGAVYRIEAN